MVYTGACRTAVEKNTFCASLERSDVKGLRTVMHEPIKVYGEQLPSMVSRSSGRSMTTRALATDIKRNVLSVGEGTDQGNWYVFGPGGVQFMTQLPLQIPPDEHREDFRRAGNQYFLDVGEVAAGSYADNDLVMSDVRSDALDNEPGDDPWDTGANQWRAVHAQRVKAMFPDPKSEYRFPLKKIHDDNFQTPSVELFQERKRQNRTKKSTT
jgi:hypothetical protein